jgi:hypothetical protein
MRSGPHILLSIKEIHFYFHRNLGGGPKFQWFRIEVHTLNDI